jgi:hypothetical protein
MIKKILTNLNNNKNFGNCYILGSVSLSCISLYYFLNYDIENYNYAEDMTCKKMYRLYNDL